MKYFISYTLKNNPSFAGIGFANAIVDLPKKIIDEDGLRLATELINQGLEKNGYPYVAVILNFQQLDNQTYNQKVDKDV